MKKISFFRLDQLKTPSSALNFMAKSLTFILIISYNGNFQSVCIHVLLNLTGMRMWILTIWLLSWWVTGNRPQLYGMSSGKDKIYIKFDGILKRTQKSRETKTYILLSFLAILTTFGIETSKKFYEAFSQLQNFNCLEAFELCTGAWWDVPPALTEGRLCWLHGQVVLRHGIR